MLPIQPEGKRPEWQVARGLGFLTLFLNGIPYMGPERDFDKGRKRTDETKHQPRIVIDLIKLNT
jgi:hypothetical protein